jgi:hypothetical protein
VVYSLWPAIILACNVEGAGVQKVLQTLRKRMDESDWKVSLRLLFYNFLIGLFCWVLDHQHGLLATPQIVMKCLIVMHRLLRESQAHFLHQLSLYVDKLRLMSRFSDMSTGINFVPPLCYDAHRCLVLGIAHNQSNFIRVYSKYLETRVSRIVLPTPLFFPRLCSCAPLSLSVFRLPNTLPRSWISSPILPPRRTTPLMRYGFIGTSACLCSLLAADLLPVVVSVVSVGSSRSLCLLRSVWSACRAFMSSLPLWRSVAYAHLLLSLPLSKRLPNYFPQLDQNVLTNVLIVCAYVCLSIATHL